MGDDNISDLAIYGAVRSVAQNVRILLVDYDRSSLMTLASRFEAELYKVTSTESANVALSLFRAQKVYYDIVVADCHMPEMDVIEFVHKLQCQRMNIPITLITENFTRDSAAFLDMVCYVFSKPLRHRDIAMLWQHIPRVTGKMPSHADVEIYGNSRRDEDARNDKRSDLRRNIINTDRENTKRRKNQTAEDSNSFVDTNKDDGCNSKKSRMNWTPSLHKKFVDAISVLGEHAVPKMILKKMNVPGLTNIHVASHLQKFRAAHPVNQERSTSPVMPTVLTASPTSIFVQGQTSGTGNSNSMAACGAPQIPRSPSWQEAPNLLGYGPDGVNENLDALNYSENNSTNAIIASGGVHIPGGGGGVGLAQGTDQNHDTNENYCADVEEEGQVFPCSFGQGTMEGDPEILASGNLSNGLQDFLRIPRSPGYEVAPNFLGYGLDGHVNENLDASNYSSNSYMNAVIASGGVHIPEGSGGVQIAQGIGQNHDTNVNYHGKNIVEQGQVLPRISGHGTVEGGREILASVHLNNGLQAPDHELAGATDDMTPSSGLLSNGLQSTNQEPRGATSVMKVASGLINGLQTPNLESAGDYGTGMYGLENAGHLVNMISENFEEGTSANQQFNGMPSEELRTYTNNIIQDFEAWLGSI